jgi:hypothetical protein
MADLRQVSSARTTEDQGAVSAGEQLHAEPSLQRLDAVTDGTWGQVQLLRGQLEAQMPSGGLEQSQGVEWRQAIRHGQTPFLA